ncbi:hypothetical protein GALMADRAFT_676880 [Galerina marginata CBS 339.88]|uniref:Uncharacterized protein n=1 Tax=Galerina marginata (strain CBS 339.88) TaxID=685588 RepID=A0A067TNA1_GALM3|nr:hypothetical protein GALMADRAFT_676880 [Galerina marginata CBS 339.88]
MLLGFPTAFNSQKLSLLALRIRRIGLKRRSVLLASSRQHPSTYQALAMASKRITAKTISANAKAVSTRTCHRKGIGVVHCRLSRCSEIHRLKTRVRVRGIGRSLTMALITLYVLERIRETFANLECKMGLDKGILEKNWECFH